MSAAARRMRRAAAAMKVRALTGTIAEAGRIRMTVFVTELLIKPGTRGKAAADRTAAR